MPGTGHNASTDILTQNPIFYKDSSKISQKFCDLYIYVRPLEDFRSIHNGIGKIRENFMYGDALLRGSSHSTIYLIEALGLAKALKQKYETYGIIGLSLGGNAAFYLSLEAEPDFTFSASGWHSKRWTFQTLSYNQILIPGFNQYYNENYVIKTLKKQKTNYLLTYGLAESSVYGYEAKTNSTCNWITKNQINNVSCKKHNGGHEFPRDILEQFIKKNISMK